MNIFPPKHEYKWWEYSTTVLIKTPVRPDDDEDVAANGKKEETTHPGSVVGIDHVSDYLDHIEDPKREKVLLQKNWWCKLVPDICNWLCVVTTKT